MTTLMHVHVHVHACGEDRCMCMCRRRMLHKSTPHCQSQTSEEDGARVDRHCQSKAFTVMTQIKCSMLRRQMFHGNAKSQSRMLPKAKLSEMLPLSHSMALHKQHFRLRSYNRGCCQAKPSNIQPESYAIWRCCAMMLPKSNGIAKVRWSRMMLKSNRQGQSSIND